MKSAIVIALLFACFLFAVYLLLFGEDRTIPLAPYMIAGSLTGSVGAHLIRGRVRP